MVTRRTILIYNLGLVLVLIVCGLLMTYAATLLGDPAASARTESSAQAKASKEILEDQDIEHLRTTASFYLKLSEDLKRARYADNLSALHDVRDGSFLMAALFGLGALLGFAAAANGNKRQDQARAGEGQA